MNRLFILFFLFCFSSTSVIAQETSKTDKKFHAGIKAGMNTSQMTGDGFAGFYKFSVVAGAFANVQIKEKWKFQYELIYQGKGSNKPARPDKGIYDSYKVRLSYIEVPLLFQYKMKRFEIEMGPGVAFLIGSKEWDQNGEKSTTSNNWRTFELDAMLGLNFYASDKFFINLRTHHSVTSIVTTTAVTPYGTFGGAWNIVLAFTLNYQF